MTVIDAAGETTTYSWNAKGQLDSVLNAKGELTDLIYVDDFLREVQRPLGWRVFVDYDSSLRPWHLTDPDGALYTFEYDTLDRIRTLRFPDASTRTWSYDRLDVGDYKDREDRPRS